MIPGVADGSDAGRSEGGTSVGGTPVGGARWWRRSRPSPGVPSAPDDRLYVHHLDLLEGALRSDDSLTIVWDERGATVLEHVPEPELRASGSVTSARLARLLSEACSVALAGEHFQQELSVYGPPRRELVIRAAPIAAKSAERSVPGPIIGAVARVHDVTAQRRIEEVRRDFVANISHELRTPVGAIGVLAEMIVGEKSPETISRLASRMDLEASRLSRMVDELMALAQIESAADAPQAVVSLRDVVEAAVERVQAGADHHGIIIEVSERPTGGEAFVSGERGQLVSALHNLLDNAVKYSDDGSRVLVRVDSEHSPGHVQLSVTDQGIGIPLGDRDRIFERFYRVDRARTRDTGGIGLGLAIVRHVAANFGGHVQVQSIEGQGSTFTITLPAAPENGVVDGGVVDGGGA